MGYAATTVVILYLGLYQPFVIHRAHHVWFDEYNSRLSIEDKHTPGSLLLQQYPEYHIHNSDFLYLIPYELDLTSTKFCDTTILTYEIELPPPGNKVGFNLLNDEYFTIPYITDTIPNSPASHQLPTQIKRNVSIISMSGEEPITSQSDLDEINRHQNPHGKSKVDISLFGRKSYQITYLKDIQYIFDQARPVVSHPEFCLPEKSPTPNNISEVLNFPQRYFWREASFVKYDKNKSFSIVLDPIPIKYLIEEFFFLQ